MSRYFIYLCLIWLTICHEVDLQPSTTQTPELRLYVPQEMRWRMKDLTDGWELFHDSSYDRRKPTVLVLHGSCPIMPYDGNKTVLTLLDALIEARFHNTMNILFLHAPHLMDNNLFDYSYFFPASKLEYYGDIIANIMKEAIKHEMLKVENINLLGISLGAQLAGYVGRAMDSQVYSIVGLDPAGPGFQADIFTKLFSNLQHVSKSDAQFVHLYHTDSNFLGTESRLGTADFQFNTKTLQPGCSPFSKDLVGANAIERVACSHDRAVVLFSKVLLGEKQLIALRCDTVLQFEQCDCEGNPTTVLQYPIDTSVEGIYFLKTAEKAPFGRGTEGITCPMDHEKKHLEEQENIEMPITSIHSTVTAIKDVLNKNIPVHFADDSESDK